MAQNKTPSKYLWIQELLPNTTEVQIFTIWLMNERKKKGTYIRTKNTWLSDIQKEPGKEMALRKKKWNGDSAWESQKQHERPACFRWPWFGLTFPNPLMFNMASHVNLMAKIWRQETRLWEVPLCATTDSFFTPLPNKHSWNPDCVTNKRAKFCT